MDTSSAFNPDRVYNKVLTMNNGLTIPQFGFGLYQVTLEEPPYWAIKYGYRYLDSAAFYQNEENLGKQVKRAYKDFGLKREDLFISTKVFNDMFGYEKTKESVEASLKKMDVEYIDLMFLHFPGTKGLEKDDPKHIENRHGSWKALEEFVDKGLIKSIGVSNYLPHHIEDLLQVCRIKPVVN